MDVKGLEELLKKAKSDKNNEQYRNEYLNEYVNAIGVGKITEDIVNITIEAIDIDHGDNFLDRFETLGKKDADNVWKLIQNSKVYNDNKNDNSYKLLCAMVNSSFLEGKNTTAYIGKIFTAMVQNAKKMEAEKRNNIAINYILENLPSDFVFPKWTEIRMSSDNTMSICKIFNDVALYSESNDRLSLPLVFSIKKWTKNGVDIAEEAKELKEKQKNIPPRKTSELVELVEHFKNVEDELDKSVVEAAKYAIENRRLMERLSDANLEIKKLNAIIDEKEKQIAELNNKVEEKEKALDESKELNQSQELYRENSQAAIYQDIARALKMEYEDYVASENDEMDIELGEIYREKVRSIFNILERKGIKVRYNG